MDKNEIDSGCENIVRVDKLNRCITVIKPNSLSNEPPKIYYFDNVFAEDSTQVRIQEHYSLYFYPMPYLDSHFSY